MEQKGIAAARRLLRPNDPMLDDETAKVVPREGEYYLLQSLHADATPLRVAKGLRDWSRQPGGAPGWPVLPIRMWGLDGANHLLVGAEKPPPATPAGARGYAAVTMPVTVTRGNNAEIITRFYLPM